ncbi:hypothetical protein B0H14DRAFT_2570244 [Mycena olivaceomarginata]|nr:hypothetical protein B0H14DRAFT_2570244 [Mycena olivaceomarginata]
MHRANTLSSQTPARSGPCSFRDDRPSTISSDVSSSITTTRDCNAHQAQHSSRRGDAWCTLVHIVVRRPPRLWRRGWEARRYEGVRTTKKVEMRWSVQFPASRPQRRHISVAGWLHHCTAFSFRCGFPAPVSASRSLPSTSKLPGTPSFATGPAYGCGVSNATFGWGPDGSGGVGRLRVRAGPRPPWWEKEEEKRTGEWSDGGACETLRCGAV